MPTATSPVGDIVAGLGAGSGEVAGVTNGTVELSVYGRDAADARVLAKLWRFCFYRDSEPTLILDRTSRSSTRRT